MKFSRKSGFDLKMKKFQTSCRKPNLEENPFVNASWKSSKPFSSYELKTFLNFPIFFLENRRFSGGKNLTVVYIKIKKFKKK